MKTSNKNEGLAAGRQSRFGLLAVFIVAVSGLCLSLALFFTTQAWDDAQFQITFETESRQAVSFLKQGIDNGLEVLRALRTFHRSSEGVTRPEFRMFAGDYLKRRAGLQAVEWIPFVRQREREGCEKAAQRDGLGTYQFTETDDTGNIVTAGQRPEYYPVYYVEPYTGNEAALGFDLGCNPVRREALSLCRDTGKVIATPPIRLVQETGHELGLLVFIPVYRRNAVTHSVESRRENLKGFYLVVIRLSDFLDRILLHYQSSEIDIYVFDQSLRYGNSLLYFRSLAGKKKKTTGVRREDELKAGIHFLASYRIGGREWSIIVTPTPPVTAPRRTWRPWVALIVVVVITSLITVYLVQIQKGAETARQHLRKQATARESLEKEIALREQAEGLLTASRERYRKLFEEAPMMYVITRNENGVPFITDCNHLFLRSLDYRQAEVQGKPLAEFYSPKSQADLLEGGGYARALAGESIMAERELVTRNGRIIPTMLCTTTEEDESGRVIGTLAMFVDMSYRKKAEEALRESEERFRKSFDNNPAWLTVTRLESNEHVEVNGAWTEVFGYEREEAVGHTPVELGIYDAATYENIVEQARAQGSVRNQELPIRNRKGEERLVLVSRELIDIAGEPHLLAMGLDITELRKNEQDLRKLAYDLKERHKELTCLYRLSQILEDHWSSFGEMFQAILPLLPVACQFPDIACARIHFDDMHFATDNFRQSAWNMSSVITVSGKARGLAEVGYLEQMPDSHEGPFLREEMDLINAVAEALGRAIERDEADRALRESEQRFRAIFDNQHAVMLLIDPETGAIVDCSSGACDFYGYDKDTLTNKTVADLNVLSRQEIFRKMQLAETQHLKYFDFRHRLKNGAIRDVEVCSGPVVAAGKRLLFSVVSDVTDRKRAEAALKDSEDRYRSWFRGLLNSIPDLVFFKDLDGVYLGCNDSFAEYLGRSQDRIIGGTDYDFVPKDVADLFRESDRLMVEQGEPRHNEEWIDYPNGKRILVDTIKAPLRSSDGQCIGVIGVSRDITSVRQSQELLQEREASVRAILNNIPFLMWLKDRDGRFLAVNEAFARSCGCQSSEELVGKTDLDVWPRELAESYRTDDDEVMRSRVQKSVEEPIIDQGETKWFETFKMPILDDRGRVLGTTGFSRDITDRKQEYIAEQRRAQEAQRLLASALEQAAEAILITDVTGKIEYVNPSCEIITGYTANELIGKNPRILKSGAHTEAYFEQLWRVITEGGTWKGRLENKRKDGGLVHWETAISPVRNTEGRIVNYLAIMRDVTKELILEKQLVQSQKMEAIGTLAGGIAHDFNNIIFAITGYTELALEETPEGSPMRWDLERVLSAGKRAGEMVKQILTFSRQSEPVKQPLDLSPIVKEGLKFLRGSIPSTIEIRQNIEVTVGKVYADPTQIHQVLMNLCTNASHAMRDTKGILSVDLSLVSLDAEYAAQHLGASPGKYIKLTVSDTGHGIPPEIIQRIFEPYFTTKETGDGTGLGLAVIHGIVKSHGGAINVYSDPGQGTTFDVYFPAMEAGSEPHISPAGHPLPTGNERILMVDDEQILAEMGQSMLERMGYEVMILTSPLEALALLRSDPQRFDLVITDLTMPKMTGVELAAEIALLRPGMPVVLCTGFGHKLTEEDVLQAGVQEVIKKPISKKDIAETVRKVLDRND